MYVMDKKITVTLAGQIFTIINQEDLNYVEDIADMVDRKIKYVQRENEHFSVTAAAVLSCMDFCDELTRTQKEIVQRNKELFEEKEKSAALAEQIKSLMSEIQSLKVQASAENPESPESGEKDSVKSPEEDDRDEESHGQWVKENSRPAKKEYVPRNNRKRNKKKAENTDGRS